MQLITSSSPSEIDAYSLYQNALVENAEQTDKLRLENYLKAASCRQVEMSLTFYFQRKKVSIEQASEQLEVLENRIIAFIEKSSLKSDYALTNRMGHVFQRLHLNSIQEQIQENQKIICEINEINREVIEKSQEVMEITLKVNEKIQVANTTIHEAKTTELYTRAVFKMALSVVSDQCQRTQDKLDALQEEKKQGTYVFWPLGKIAIIFRVLSPRNLKIATLALSIFLTFGYLRKNSF